jgi:hypothetical protein
MIRYLHKETVSMYFFMHIDFNYIYYDTDLRDSIIYYSFLFISYTKNLFYMCSMLYMLF